MAPRLRCLLRMRLQCQSMQLQQPGCLSAASSQLQAAQLLLQAFPMCASCSGIASESGTEACPCLQACSAACLAPGTRRQALVIAVALARAAFPLCLHCRRQQQLQEEQLQVALLPSGNGSKQKLQLPAEAAALLASGQH